MMRMAMCVIVMGMAAMNVAVAADQHCHFHGKSYASGAIVCQEGKQERCSGGTWKRLGTGCAHRTGHVMPGVRSHHATHPVAPKQPAEPRHPAPQQPPTP